MPRRRSRRVAPRQLDQVQQLVDARSNVGLRPSQELGGDGNVLFNGHVRKKPDALEDVADAPAQRCDVSRAYQFAVDAHRAAIGFDQPVDELQSGRLAGAGCADQRNEEARLDLQRGVMDRERASTVK